MRSDAVHRALESEVDAARQRRGGSTPTVLDAGGGSGVWSVPLAKAGCAVTVVDPTPNALATLQRRAAEEGVADRITGVQGDTGVLGESAPEGGADLVLGHGLLEVVDDVPAALRDLAACTAPDGALSVLVVNRYAAVLGRLLAGRVPEALRMFRDPDGRLDGSASDTLQRRFDSEQLTAVLTEAGLSVEVLQGQGAVRDLLPGSVLEDDPSAAEALAQLEDEAAARPPLRDIATRLHAMARVRG
jgi:SAM-dependent methyltransferase